MTSFPLRPESDIDNLPATTVPIDGGGPLPLVNAQVEPAQITDYLRILAAHWRLVVCAAVAGCLGGVLLTLLQAPSYRVKAAIEIQNINGEFMNMKRTRPVADENYGNDALLDMATQTELLQSQSLLESTKRAIKASLKPDWVSASSGMRKLILGGSAVGISDAMLDKIADSVKVRAVGVTRILQVQVDSPNPNLSADFANALIAEYIRDNIRARTQMTEAAEGWTRGQLSDTRNKLEASEKELQRYASVHGLVFTSGRENISDDRLKQVQSDLVHARTELAEKDARRDVAATSIPESLPSVEDDTSLRDLRAKLNDLKRQEAELLTVYKPDYSDVKKIRAQVEQTQAALEQAQTRVVSRIDNEYKESARKEKSLTRDYDSAVRQAENESETTVGYDILKREVDANLTAYQDMLQKVKELNLAAAIRSSNIRIVDPATPPKRPNSPNLPLNVVLGVFSALSVTIAMVLVFERSNHTLRHPGEAMMRLGVPELAVVPSMLDGMRNFAPLTLRQPENENGFGLQVFQNNDFDTYAPTTDAFRTILTSIVLSGATGKSPRSIVISSASAKEGKTTIASNMALACARAGKRVLLIDGDLRSPQIHKLFGLSNAIGFGNLLQSGCEEEEAHLAVLETQVRGLSVLPAGSFSAAPADLLFQPQLQILLRTYRKAFDIVLLDSPPLLNVPDSRLLGRCADGVVLVARAKRTNRDSLVMACHRLGLDRSRVLGVVLNDWKGESSPYPV